MKKMIMIQLLAALVFISSAQADKALFNPKLLKKVDACATSSDHGSTLVIIKQWHFTPGVNTKTDQKTKYPQSENQVQIYQQLSEWVSAGTVDEVIAEGCEGEIDSKFKDVFQGWSYSDVSSKTSDAQFAKLLAHPVVKLEAKYTNRVKSVCGDSLSEIKKSQMAISDARADVGYFTRLAQYKDKPEMLKSYLSGVREAYQLKVDATLQDAQKALVVDLKKSLAIFQDATHERDLSFVRKFKQSESKKPVALVVGGLHAADLKQILEEKKMNCVILEPLAYKNDEEAMSQSLKSAVDHL